MFEIDLKRGAARLEGATQAPAALAASFVPVVLSLLVLLGGLWAASSWMARATASKRVEVGRLEEAVTASRRQLAEISGKRRALLEVGSEEIYWSDQLRALSRRMPDKLWISKVAVERSGGEKGTPVTRTLRVEGGFLSHPAEGNLDLVGQFVEALQKDPAFEQTFDDLRLESVQRSGGETHALAFALSARFR